MRCTRSLLLAVFLLGTAGAATAAGAWQTANLTMVDEHVLPRYRILADAGAELARRTEAFCAAPDQQGLESVRDGFHTGMDAWQGIQHIRFGPVDWFLRHHRFQMWPDKHQTGAKQLRVLLAEQDPAELAPERFAEISVAVQGLTALEKLLFASGVDVARFTTAKGGAGYRCRLAEAIADNLASISKGIVEQWAAGEPPYRQVVESAESGNDFFYTSQEVTGRFLKDLNTQVQAIADLKLSRPLDESLARAKPRRAESWRSERSLRNIVLNLKGTEELYRIGFAPLLKGVDDGLDQRIRKAFADTLAAADAIDGPLAQAAASERRRPQAERLLAATRELQRALGEELPVAIDIPLGFNSLDGD